MQDEAVIRSQSDVTDRASYLSLSRLRAQVESILFAGYRCRCYIDRVILIAREAF